MRGRSRGSVVLGVFATAIGLGVAATPAGSVIGPNQSDITASSPAFPGGSVTFTVTTGFSCNPTSIFIPPNSTVTVLNQAGTTTIVPATNVTPTATGGTVTLQLPAGLALGAYTMQFLCNNSAVASIFGNNEFAVSAAPPAPPASAPAPVVAPARFTG